jgi:hypothetical protein
LAACSWVGQHGASAHPAIMDEIYAMMLLGYNADACVYGAVLEIKIIQVYFLIPLRMLLVCMLLDREGSPLLPN